MNIEEQMSGFGSQDKPNKNSHLPNYRFQMDNDFQNYISDMSKSVNLDQSVIVQSSQIANLNLAQYSNIMSHNVSKLDPKSPKGSLRNGGATHQNSYRLDNSFARATYQGSS
jgi:hypothetical protein